MFVDHIHARGVIILILQSVQLLRRQHHFLRVASFHEEDQTE